MMEPSILNSASVVATAAQTMQNPEAFLLLDVAGLVSNGFVISFSPIHIVRRRYVRYLMDSCVLRAHMVEAD